MTNTKAIEILNNLISEISGIQRNSSEHTRWLANVLRVLDEKFGADSQYSTTIRAFPWKETGSGIYNAYNYQSERERDHQNAFRRQMEQAKGIILSAVDALTERVSESNEDASPSESSFDTKKVFIVHGHDNNVRNEVELFVRSIGYEPIILCKRADKGDTIIEKIEREAKDVCYAIVIYTSCDLGKDKNDVDFKPRARQNVVFEHGFMCAHIGRSHVCALLEEGVEQPGDLKGVVYKPLDTAGAWKYQIADEMKAVGLDVDKNKI